MAWETRTCQQCKKQFEFSASPSRVKAGWGKFCSKSCNTTHRLNNGFKPSDALVGKRAWNNVQETRICEICANSYAVSPSSLKKTCSKKCMGALMASQRTGELSGNWRGAEVGYNSLHKWVSNRLGKPQSCESCGIKGSRGTKRDYHWSNISGKYLRDLGDWQRLCVPCHSKFDNNRKVRYATA